VTTAWTVAQVTGAPCRILHVAREPAHPALGSRPAEDRERIHRQILDEARATVVDALREHVPAAAIAQLEVHLGNPAWVLARAVEETKAGLLVLGGKHHAALVRWFGGSTVHHAVRTIDVPILVAAPTDAMFPRILVATDLSDAARPTLEAALRFAGSFGSHVKVLHIVEPLPSVPDIGIELDEREHLRLAEEGTQALLSDIDPEHAVQVDVRAGAPARAIAEEAATWEANLVVVGSHGKGWVDRVLLGSTTERLLNRLPSPVLVIPIRASDET
jgi:nucleotide-binding universal stress UspA family protein